MFGLSHKTEDQLNAALGTAHENPSFVRAEIEIGKYVKANSAKYGYIAQHKGAGAAARAVREDMRLDGYGAILDAVGDNLLALVPIIIIIALVPYIATQVIGSFNTTLPEGWDGGLDAQTVWVTASLLLGAIITISLVTLILVQLKKFRRDSE